VPAPLREGEQHRQKLRSDKYQFPAARLLENYEFDSSVEADEDTDPEVCDDVVTRPEASGADKPRRKTRASAAMQPVSMAAAKVAEVKTAKLEAEKKKRKRKESPPPVVETSVILTPSTREVESDEEEDEAANEAPVVEERTVRRSLSPTAKRQWEFEQKTTKDDLRQGLEAQRVSAAAQARMLVSIKAQTIRLTLRALTSVRQGR
jgi:hypothetical protein